MANEDLPEFGCNPGLISLINADLVLNVKIRNSDQIEWTIESSTDLVHWVDVLSKLQQQPATDGPNYRWPAMLDSSMRYFRLQMKFIPWKMYP